jgi:hypothetical protein
LTEEPILEMRYSINIRYGVVGRNGQDHRILET